MHDTPDDPVGLHLAQLLNQHLLRNPGDRALQLGEAQHRPAEEVEKDHELPASLEDTQGVFHALGPIGRRQEGILTF